MSELLPEDQLHSDLWEVFIQGLKPMLVLVFQCLVQLVITVEAPRLHIGWFEAFLNERCHHLTHLHQTLLPLGLLSKETSTH